MIVLARFDQLPDAAIAQGKLAAHGIASELRDIHLVQTDWLASLAVDGIKLLVTEHDAAQAEKILATDDSDLLDGNGFF